MSLSHLWPNFPLERVLYEDDDLIVIDKLSTSRPTPLTPVAMTTRFLG